MGTGDLEPSFEIATGAPTREPVCEALAAYPAETTDRGLRFKI